MRFYSCLLLLLFITVTTQNNVYAAKVTEFNYKDWQVVCDNTLTCRAVGYSSENGDSDVSILLIRKAGANQSFTAYIKTNDQQDEQQEDDTFALSINHQFLGKLKNKKDEAYRLSQHQISQIIQALKGKNNTVIFHQNGKKWMLSNSGFNAVMLKMDEAQGRIGTVGAVVKQGNKNESHVYAPVPAPVIKKASVSTSEQSKKLTLVEVIKIFPRFKERFDKEADCDSFDLSNDAEDSSMTAFQPLFQLIKLDKRHNLLEASCWVAAYNDGRAFWVIPTTVKPHDNQIKFVTNSGSYYNKGEIVASLKERGLGDCWNRASWTWDGQQFLLSSEKITGICRGFIGGTWNLPTFVSTIQTR